MRQVLASQLELTTDGTLYVEDPPKRYGEYQKAVNGNMVPSEVVIDQHREEFGHEYRLETEGAHPVERLRAPQPVK